MSEDIAAAKRKLIWHAVCRVIIFIVGFLTSIAAVFFVIAGLLFAFFALLLRNTEGQW
jgi:hypothetical protein